MPNTIRCINTILHTETTFQHAGLFSLSQDAGNKKTVMWALRLYICTAQDSEMTPTYKTVLIGPVVKNVANGAGGLGLIPGPVTLGTVVPTARHRCDVSHQREEEVYSVKQR